MNCAEAKLKLEPCVSGTLSPGERVALEEHLAICEGCRLELELTRAVMGATAPEAPDEPPALPLEAPLVQSEPEPRHPDPPPASTVFDEISFADVGSELSASSAPAGPAAPASAPGSSGPDLLANLAPKPEPAKPSSEKWDFEPADVPRDSGPPEASLSIAHEALKRKREVDKKRKAAFVRLALWGGGIGCGLVLLGVSVWMALAFRQDKPPDSPPNGVTPSVTPAPTETTPSPPEPTGTPAAPDIGAAPSPVPPASTTTDAAVPAPTPGPDSQAPVPPAPTLLEATPGVAPSPGPPPPAAKGKPKPGAKAAAKPAAGAAARKGGGDDDNELFPWKPVDDAPIQRRAPVRQSAAPRSPNPSVPKAAPPEASPPQPAPVNPPEASRPETGTTPPGAAPAPETTAPPAPETPQAPAPTKPIDRVHLATEKAAKDGDLDALRKLKSAWKSLIGSTAGPDRARAKREYADCLWSIQEITGRNSDRREALAAYRDYVLYAPAGGTDPRTVGRMRQLEDILINR
jgi:putative zinc finger protein